MSRTEEIKEFTRKIKELENKYQVKIIAEDEYVGLLYQDKLDNILYENSNGELTKI
ncbi:hypothetical protein [Bacillus xiamenensis]|uniref:hypothetical protein n=1 Tax=Bacillus xiamenensis TaxID=1178537 RepID=UPI00031CFF80|nr:hypothetical protein [Bacillus xiamenensis]